MPGADRFSDSSEIVQRECQYWYAMNYHLASTFRADNTSFLPIVHLQEWARAGRIAGLTARFHGVPTDYSQRRTREEDAPEVLRRCREDAADVALLVPL